MFWTKAKCRFPGFSFAGIDRNDDLVCCRVEDDLR